MKSINQMTKQELIDFIVAHLKSCQKLQLREYIRYGLEIEFKE